MRFMFKKIITLLLIISFGLFSFVKVNSADAFTNSHWFTVTVKPPNAGVQAEYDISGGISDFDDIDTIVIYFQWTSFKYAHPDRQYVIVNGSPASFVDMESVPDQETARMNLKMTIGLSVRINSGEEINIQIKKEAGIINPVDPRPCYQVAVYLYSNGAEKEYIGSDLYAITQSVVSTPDVTVDPPVKSMPASYKISFVTGVNGLLHANRDDIRIKFPKGTVIPSNPFSQYILVNGHTCEGGIYRDSEDPFELRIYTPIEIKPKTPVTILIKKGFGIINTDHIGENFVYVSTYQEPDWVKSKPFEIVPPEIQDLSISLTPDTVTLPVSVKIQFKTSPVGMLKKGDFIHIIFPKSFYVPSQIGEGLVTVNGSKVATKVSGNRVDLKVDGLISAGSEVVVKIPAEAGIKNPQESGKYDIFVYTDADSVKAKFTVSVSPSEISDVKFSVQYNGTGVTSSYYISFKTGPTGALKAGKDFIGVVFDKNFKLPKTISPDSVTVNNVNSPDVTTDVYSMVVTVPADVYAGERVRLVISEKAGIVNPETTGEYGVSVYTSKEKSPVESNKIKIVPLPVVEFKVNPPVPDGKSGYYLENPSVQIFTPNGDKVYYKIDNGEFQLYTSPVIITDGVHTLYAYAVDKNGNKGKIFSKVIKVDTAPPSIIFNHLFNGVVYVNSSNAEITGKVSEPCAILKINGVEAAINKDLSFSVNLQVVNNGSLAVYARDLAGKSIAMVLKVSIDDTPPEIVLLDPDTANFSTAESTYGIRVRVDEKSVVKLNGEMMDQESGNVFYKNVSLNDGLNVFTVTATDVAGNKSSVNITINKVNQIKVILKIGSKDVMVGDKQIQLDVAPIIENDTTLVPLRFISETFGAQVLWNGALKIVTLKYKLHEIQLQVNSKVVIADGQIERLKVAPIIKNNRTLVPLRFISETFGAQVLWDGDIRTITIIYTP